MVLGRTGKQYWHLMRTMMTQLVEYERIVTTQAKAKHLHSYAEYIIRHAKRAATGVSSSKNILERILRTKMTRQKAVLELAERFKSYNNHFTKVSHPIYNRRGDNAPMVTIQYRGHSLGQFPKNGQETKPYDLKGYRSQLWNQRKDKLESLLNNETDQTKRSFFEKKVRQIDYELQLERKRQKTGPIYTYHN